MPEVTVVGERLDQWKGIAEYLGRDVSTVIRWARESGLPVHRVPGAQKRRPVFAYRHEIDGWMASSGVSGKTAHGDRPQRLQGVALLEAPLPDTEEQASAEQPVQTPPGNSRRRAFRLRFVFWILGGLIVCGGTVAALRQVPGDLQNGGERLVASLSFPLRGNLLAAGGNLYFGVSRGGRIALFALPEAGGPAREIPAPFIHADPQAVSPDGNRLLVLSGVGHEVERPLWWVPSAGGKPARIGNFLCHAAALSPDGKTIAYAFGYSLYLTADNGATTHLLNSFTAVPQDVSWSLDGERVLTTLMDSEGNTAVWKIVLDKRDPLVLDSLKLVIPQLRRESGISPVLDKSDDLFFGTDDTHPAIYLFRQSRWPWFSPVRIQLFARAPSHVSGLALDRGAQQLYYSRGTTERDELDQFDQRTGETRPFLPGLSAHDLIFSRDGLRIAYVTDPGQANSRLWIAGSDGSGAKQVDTRGMDNIELPNWSPDGKQLAFMARRPGEPYHIFVVSQSGGEPRAASHSTDNQGAPTWSPDGRSLIYGRVICMESNACGVYRIGLRSGGVTMVPGSEGLWTARWSPDGRYIAALRPNLSQLFLLDRRTGKWRKLADGVTGNDLAWSPDSRSIYASRPDGPRPAILRVSLSGEVKEALDLSPWCKLAGRVGTWFALAPNGSLIFVRIVTGSEIVALHYEE